MPVEAEIESFTAKRYRCPYCPRTASSRTRIVDHLTRCWLNPDNRTCKTCAQFVPDASEWEVGLVAPEYCAADVDLSDPDRPGANRVVSACPFWAARVNGEAPDAG
jgi:hypothetical protein